MLPGTTWVDIDNRLGAILAARHLIELGHRRIALSLGDSQYEHVAERRSTFLSELGAEGIDVPAHFRIEHSDFADTAARGRGITELLARSDRPTAVLASSDTQALETLRAVRALGMRIPEQLSITGFDDAPNFGYDGLKLTTVHQPLFEMGEASANRLIAQIEKNIDTDQSALANPIVFAPELLVRESTGSAPS